MKKFTLNDFGVMSVQYVQHSFEYYLKSMKECGLKHIDFWGGEPHYCNYLNDSKERLIQIKELIDSYGMDVVVYTPETLAYPFSYSHPLKSVRDRAIQYMKNAIDDAKILQTNKVFINSGCGMRDLDREESFERMISSFKEIVSYAKENGIDIVLEQLQPYESNLVININDIKRVMDAINSDALKICIDVVAMHVANETIPQYFEEFGKDKIGLIHYSDTYHYVLGDGGDNPLPIKEYLEQLSKYEYDGIIDLEINDSIYWLDPHDSIKRSVEWLNQNL